MQYEEDIMELLDDDYAEEIRRRLEHVGKLDRDVEELRMEVDKMTEPFFANQAAYSQDQKLQLFERVMEKQALMAHLTEQKLDLVTSTESFVRETVALIAKNTTMFEVDLLDNGCDPAQIQDRFCKSLEYRASSSSTRIESAGAEQGTEPPRSEVFATPAAPAEKRRPGRPSKASQQSASVVDLVPSTTARNSPAPPILHERNDENKQLLRVKDEPLEEPQRKRTSPSSTSAGTLAVIPPRSLMPVKKAGPLASVKPPGPVVPVGVSASASTNKMSPYQRKKLEQQRDHQKLMSVHRERHEDFRTKVTSDKFRLRANRDTTVVVQKGTGMGKGKGKGERKKRPEEQQDEDNFDPLAPLEGIEFEEEALSFLGRAGALDVDPEFEDIARHVCEENPYGSERSSPSCVSTPAIEMPPVKKEELEEAELNSMVSEYFRESAGADRKSKSGSRSRGSTVSRESSPFVGGEVRRRERKSLGYAYSHGGDISSKGRARKLTNKAEELVSMVSTKKESKERWCVCREISRGDMVECDNSNCKIGWFHFDCVGLKEPPEGVWYCHECLMALCIS